MAEYLSISTVSSSDNSACKEDNTALPGVIQWWLIIFAFFLAFPAIDIAGISITFFIFFIIIGIHVWRKITFITKDKTNKWLILFFIAGTISTFFHPPLYREVTFLADFKTVSQYAYWILLAMYVRSNFHLIDWWRISRGLFWGLAILVVGQYFWPLKVDSELISIAFRASRNGFVYNVLCFFPFLLWYLNYSSLKRISPLLMLLLIFSVLISNGRAGFILIILQAIFIGIIIYPKLKRVFYIAFILFAMFFVIWQFYSDLGIITKVSKAVENINPRMAATIEKEGSEGDLTLDKSWLLRKLMVEKSIAIVRAYPVFGVGWLHFDKYSTKLDTSGEFRRFSGRSQEYLNSRSSHNSYAMYMAEGGLVGFFLLVIILLVALIPLLRKFLINSLTMNDIPLIALATLLIYFYAITAITGANTWFIIGASLGCSRSSAIINS